VLVHFLVQFVSFSLEQVVTKPTHITATSESTLDLFFTSNSSLINKKEVIPGISDHEIVYIEANLKHRKVVKPPRKVFLYNKANTEKISENLKTIFLNFRHSILYFRRIVPVCSSSFFLEPLLSVFILLYCFCVSVLVHFLVQFVSFSDQRFYFLVNPG
jgi:hypothetical protein